MHKKQAGGTSIWHSRVATLSIVKLGPKNWFGTSQISEKSKVLVFLVFPYIKAEIIVNKLLIVLAGNTSYARMAATSEEAATIRFMNSNLTWHWHQRFTNMLYSERFQKHLFSVFTLRTTEFIRFQNYPFSVAPFSSLFWYAPFHRICLCTGDQKRSEINLSYENGPVGMGTNLPPWRRQWVCQLDSRSLKSLALLHSQCTSAVVAPAAKSWGQTQISNAGRGQRPAKFLGNALSYDGHGIPYLQFGNAFQLSVNMKERMRLSKS